ncbi:MAG TPA: ribonuclease P protein component [Candidatus Saccharimonadales bacterium]|nr:ribonuclease P protein component [Candidatus Saccharimonadales bacterium]
MRHRFHGYGGVRAVYRDGKTVRGSMMSVKYMTRGKKSGYRAAVVVSKKVHKSAVSRNRVRRRIYEIIRQADNGLLENKDIVLTVFSDRVVDLSPEKLRAEVESLLAKASR